VAALVGKGNVSVPGEQQHRSLTPLQALPKVVRIRFGHATALAVLPQRHTLTMAQKFMEQGFVEGAGLHLVNADRCGAGANDAPQMIESGGLDGRV